MALTINAINRHGPSTKMHCQLQPIKIMLHYVAFNLIAKGALSTVHNQQDGALQL